MENMYIHEEKNTYFTQVPNYIFTDKRLVPNARLVLGYLKGKPNGWVARRKDIEDKVGINKRTFSRVLLNMEEFGYLYREETRNPTTGYKSSNYHFYFDPGLNERYTGEMPEDYFIIKKMPHKKTRLTGEQGGFHNTNETSNNSIPQKNKYGNNNKNKNYRDTADKFEAIE